MRPFSNVYPAILLFVLTCSCALPAAAQSFEDFKKQYQDDYNQFKEVYETGIAGSQEEFDAYKEAWEKEFNAFKEDMELKWGEFDERTKKQWVEYKETGEIKYKVDFEEGEGSVEILAEDDGEVEQAKEQMKEEVVKAINDKGTKQGFETKEIPNEEVQDEPILKDQVAKKEGESDEEYAERVVEDNIKTKEVTGKDGKKRTVVYLNFDLAPDHIQQRATKVAKYVKKFSEEYKIDPSLVLAIIHTESYFNPTAASHANAYGLMQLVPTSGGRDAYNAVFGEDGIPTKEFLFQSEKNINLGCAYIDILTTRYFRGATSSLTNQYLSISAYNTGAGNVAKAYTGNTSVRSALKKINKMSDQENYEHLVKNLPYEETRDYLQKVVRRSKKYKEWSGE